MLPMATDEETLRRLIVEVRVLDGSAAVLQSRLEIVNAALSEHIVASNTLDGLKGKPKGTEALVPVGAGSLIAADLRGDDKVIIGVGAGVSIEKTMEQSISDLRTRQAELEKVRLSIERQLTETLTKLEDDRRTLGELLRKRGGAVEVV